MTAYTKKENKKQQKQSPANKIKIPKMWRPKGLKIVVFDNPAVV